MLKAKSEYYIFILVLYLFVFQFAVMQYIELFKYWDEIYAVLAIPLYLSSFKGKIRIGSVRSKLFIGISVLVVVGLIGNFVYKYQVPQAIVKDVFLNMKFVLGILTTYYFFANTNIFQYDREISRHIKLIVVILFVLLIYDEIFKVFKCNEIRYGLRSEQLFYSHPTELASVSFFLLVLSNLFLSGNKKNVKYTIMVSLLIVSSLRAKAIAITAVFLVVWFFVEFLGKKVKVRQFLIFIPLAIYIAWEQIYFYFFSKSSLDTSRGALTVTALKIFRNCFPIGTGFGTFASAPSGEYYSSVYVDYGISDVWGLTPQWPKFVSDTFWPMVLGQTGFIGLVVYMYIIVVLFKEIKKTFKYSKTVYLAGMGALLYLLISSIAESSFVNPLSLPLSLVIGLSFVYCDRVQEKIKE